MNCNVKEAREISQCPENFNRDRGFTLSQAWYPVTNMLKTVQWYTNEKASQTQQETPLSHEYWSWAGTYKGHSKYPITSDH
jgi:hypothetical protein